MGVVYKAHDTKLDREVALKFLPANLTASSEDVKRFELEAKAISALNHPNIATIHDVDEFDGQKYLVLEYIPGGTLKSRLKQLKAEDKNFSISEVLNYGVQIAEGLAHAHRHGIIHRDVKTDNMMLTEEGKIKLTDFGLAKLRGSMQITKTGSTLGTAAYMSPEQIRGEEVDQRSDIFSFGIVLYEIVTSHLPFRGEFEAALSYSILNENPPAISSMRPDVPKSFEQIINRCLEKDKTKRFQSVDEIGTELRSVERSALGGLSSSPERSEDRSRKSTWIVAAVIVILAAIGIYIFYPKLAPTTTISKSIAVLPFKNLSDSKEDEYFSDGLTDDIITQLSKISGIEKVIARTSVMRYKETNKSIHDIGKELDVATVLEGSVRRAGNQIRIVAQLIDVRNEGHLWADTYDKEMTQVFAIQSDVAQQIATALEAKISPAVKSRIDKKQTENTEAYPLYLKGRFYWNKRRAEDLQKAMEYFHQAISVDSEYALAYAGLASAYAPYPEYSGRPASEYIHKAEDAAKKALDLDGTLAEAHAVLGLIKSQYEYDWEGSEREYKRAIELNPNYPTAYHWYRLTLSSQGRFDEALTKIERAQALDPLSLVINWNLVLGYKYMGQYDRMINQVKKTLELDPNFPLAHSGLGYIFVEQTKYDNAIAEFQKVRTIAPNDPSGISGLGYTYARAGRKKDALQMLNELLKLAKQGYSISVQIAQVYAGLG
ncbi:MAG: protein kinase, partial [Ignavibacteriales bacterium]|nr:protein kinase [Ignavibacteriales bacterium]